MIADPLFWFGIGVVFIVGLAVYMNSHRAEDQKKDGHGDHTPA